MSVVPIIQRRILEAGAPWRASDNIAKYIRKGELKQLENELTYALEAVRACLIIDPTDPNSADTPRRMAKQYIHEIMAGRYYKMPEIRAFPNGHDEMGHYSGLQVMQGAVKSLCSHHHQPVTGIAFVGVLPGDSMMGLSKTPRIINWLSRRGTLQEELTRDIAHAVARASKTPDVAVTIYARHGCCENRGIMAHNSDTATSYVLGKFMEADVLRNEFETKVTHLIMRSQYR